MLRALPLSVVLVLTNVGWAASADVEVFGGLGIWNPRLDTVYDASYTPSRVSGIDQRFKDPDPRSYAQQLLVLQAKTSAGVGLGVNVFLTSVLGFQVLFDHAFLDVAGDNPPHEVSLTYDTIAFPSSDRVERTTTYSFDSPDTDGRLDALSLSFNLAARFGNGRRLSGSVSGGPTYFRSHVEAERLGAQAAWLGGHAVLFSDLYELSYRTRAAGSLGFNLGGQLDVSLGPHVSVVVDGRWLAAPRIDTTVELDDFVTLSVIPASLRQVQSLLDLPPLEIDPAYARVLFGVKWKP